MSERRALAGAGAAHLALLAALSLGWAAMTKPQPAPDAVAVDLLDIADTPKASAEAREATAPPPAPAQPAPRVQPEPVPPEPAPEPAPKSEPVRAAPKAIEAPDPAPEAVTEAPAPPPKPKLRAKPAKPAPDPDQLARSLDAALAPAPKARPQPRANPAQLASLLDKALGQDLARPHAKPGPVQTAQPANAPLSAQAMATLQQSIAGQIARCWSILPGQQAMTVDLNVHLARDGSVVGTVQTVGVTGGANAAAERSFADSARRAVLQCAPLHLPAQNYMLWRELAPLHLDAKDVN